MTGPEPGAAAAAPEVRDAVTTTTTRTVLLVDDEPALIDVLEQYLRDDGFAVLRAGDGPTAVELFKKHGPDLVLLDLNLPGFPGTEVLRQIRAVRDVPVIMLTARVHEVDRVVGLELGADDYVGKPFSLEELVARVRAVLRRTRAESEPGSELSYHDLSIDEDAHEVRRGDRLLQLTPTEYHLLRYLLINAGRVISKAQILDHVWRYDFGGDSSVVETYISYLRKKIDLPDAPPLIQTVRGFGYAIRLQRG
jgi:two-component system OmpR family response regulator